MENEKDESDASKKSNTLPTAFEVKPLRTSDGIIPPGETEEEPEEEMIVEAATSQPLPLLQALQYELPPPSRGGRLSPTATGAAWKTCLYQDGQHRPSKQIRRRGSPLLMVDAKDKEGNEAIAHLTVGVRLIDLARHFSLEPTPLYPPPGPEPAQGSS